MAAPPTRGWTPRRCLFRPLAARPGCPAYAGMDPGYLKQHPQAATEGCPAYAGMDPMSSGTLSENGWKRLPRLRGDGPMSLRTWREFALDTGCPAYAGMDPLSANGPLKSFLEGCPAYAGMDPQMAFCSRHQAHRLPRLRGDGPTANRPFVTYNGLWLPRLRGDGPQSLDDSYSSLASLAAPPTRGWTRIWRRVILAAGA